MGVFEIRYYTEGTVDEFLVDIAGLFATNAF
jgi:hypothetical protein